MERQLLNRDYLREQFKMYWPRVQRAIPVRYKNLLNRFETFARELMETGSEAKASRKPRAKKSTTRRRTANA